MSTHVEVDNMLDCASFSKMCKDAPGLASKTLTRYEFDLIFAKSKPQGGRRLDFEHFLSALLGLAKRKYPDDEPTMAFSKLLTNHLFGLFEMPPASTSNAHEMLRDVIYRDGIS
jgi:hypothetical protein